MSVAPGPEGRPIALSGAPDVHSRTYGVRIHDQRIPPLRGVLGHDRGGARIGEREDGGART